MNTSITKPAGFELELLEGQGGNISLVQFGRLVSQLKKSHSLDHASHSFNHTSYSALATALGELDIVYVVLRQGYLYETDENGRPMYTCIQKDEVDYWLAGLGYLRFPRVANGSPNTADMVVSLLPKAQNLGCGRFLIQKLIQDAFDTLRIRRMTASVVCPVQPHYTAEQKKRVALDTKKICWMFEKFGFKFEGVTRGAIMSPTTARDETPVWYDLHRMSILDTEYLGEGKSYNLSSTPGGVPESVTKMSPWESMIQRQEEEKCALRSWAEQPENPVLLDEGYDDGEKSDDETVLGGDDEKDSDWEMPDDFED